MTFKVWLAYFITDTILSLTPGPAVLLISSQGMKYGSRASNWGAVGISTANLFYFILSSLGLSALLLSAVMLFNIVKICGAGYLMIIGSVSILRTFNKPDTIPSRKENDSVKYQNPFFQAFVTQISNPKAIIFFTSLVPQFINPEGNIPIQFSILAVTTILPETCILMGYGWLGARGSKTIKNNPNVAHWIDRIAGAILVAIGINLIFIQDLLH